MNDSQRYKLIIWHSFLEDMKKVKHKMSQCFPGYKVNYGGMAERFNWCIQKKRIDRLYPWCIEAKNKKEGILLLSYNYLLNYEPEEVKEVVMPTTNLPNRWYCDVCQKFVMKRSRIAHLKSKKHIYIHDLQRKSNN